MTAVKSSELPSSVMVHVRVRGKEVIVKMWLDGDGVMVPQKLLFEADWLYDVTRRKLIKNKTSRSFWVPLGVPEVPRMWLTDNGFIRQSPLL